MGGWSVVRLSPRLACRVGRASSCADLPGELALGEDPSASRRSSDGGIDRVVGTGVADVARHVEVLGDAHGRGRAVAERGGGTREARGVERGRLLDLARRLLDGGDLARRGQLLEHRRGPGLVGEALFLVERAEALPVGLELDLDHPERLGDEGPALLLPLGDQHQGGRLDPAHAEELAAQPAGGQRDEAGERGAPDEVDVLPGFAGPGQRLGKVVEMGEGPLDLSGRQGREAGAAHGADQLGVLLGRQVEGLQTDELALAVEVGGDDEAGGVGRQLLDGPHHRLGGLGLDQRSVDELPRLDLAPLGELRREVHLDHVALEPHRRRTARPSASVKR